MKRFRSSVMAMVAMVLCLAVALSGAYALGRDSSQHVTPPQCEGGADGFCYVDLPDCTEYVTYLDRGVMTWYRQDWCTGETAAD